MHTSLDTYRFDVLRDRHVIKFVPVVTTVVSVVARSTLVLLG